MYTTTISLALFASPRNRSERFLQYNYFVFYLQLTVDEPSSECRVIGDTPARFSSKIFILVGMRSSVEGGACAARRADGAGLACVACRGVP